MFSKGVVLIFLILGLSSSIVHAVPHEDRAPDPCADTPQVSASPSPSSVTKNPTKKVAVAVPSTAKKDTGGKGKNTTTTVDGNSKKGANPNTNKNSTSTDTGTGNQKSAVDKNSTATGNNGDPNTSLCLDPNVLAKGSESDGLNNATAGTAASLTSTNNFINFCVSTGKPITNGQQVKTGSCNPIPMGLIASATNIPSCKYVSPKNLDTLKANTAFTIKLALKNIQVGVFTNAETNYYAAPQQLNQQGNIIGHTHVLAEQLDSITSTNPTDPTKFSFFKGVDNAADADGTVSVPVAQGLPAGAYRFGTINTAANHQPCLVAVAQHGLIEDAVYVTITDDGNPANSTGTGNNNATAANGKGNNGKNSGATNTTANGNAKSTDAASKSAASPSPSPKTGQPKGKGGKGQSLASTDPTRYSKRRAFSLEYRKDRF